jgi:hypothetical protein
MRVVFRRVGKTAKSDYYLWHVCLPVCLSVRMEQLGSHCTDFRGIGYFSIFPKSVETFLVLLKRAKDNGYFR